MKRKIAAGLAAVVLTAMLPKGDYGVPPFEVKVFEQRQSEASADVYVKRAYDAFTARHYEESIGYAEQALSFLNPDVAEQREVMYDVLSIYLLASNDLGDSYGAAKAESMIDSLEQRVGVR